MRRRPPVARSPLAALISFALLVLTGSPAEAVPACSGWRVMPSDSPGSSNELVGIATIPGTDQGWAAGLTFPTFRERSLIERFDGSRWRAFPSPDPGDAANSLNGVAASGPGDAWAVGGTSNPQITGGTVTEHFDGRSWSMVPGAPLPPNSSAFLVGVVDLGPHDAWAVGAFDIDWTLVEHWDGTAWARIAAPSPAGQSGLSRIAAVSSNDIWAVGGTVPPSGGERTLVEHWDGASWAVIPSPNIGGTSADNGLFNVTVVAPEDVWAVGRAVFPDLTEHTLIEHWNGSSWIVVASPSPGADENILWGVAAAGPNDVVGVGSTSDQALHHHALVERWDGSSWSVETQAVNDGRDSALLGAAAAPAGFWAVGWHGPRNLVESGCP